MTMVDTYDLFRKLSSGAKFNRKKLPKEISPFQSRESSSKDHHDPTVKDALDFFGDGPSISSSNNNRVEQASPWPITDVKKRSRKRKRRASATSDLENASSAESVVSSDSEEEPIESEIDDHSSDGDHDLNEQGQGEVDEDGGEGVQLFAGQAPLGLGWKKGGAMADEKVERRRRKKRRKKLDKETKETLRRQEANAFRNAHRIYVSGPDVPDAVGSFDQLSSSPYSLPRYILKNVAAMGYREPTPIQMQAIPLMLHDREVLACAPTGSGKTAAFIIPILAKLKKPQKCGFRAVIVSPTRELAQQTYREFVRLSTGSGFKIHVLTKAKANANTFGSQSSQRFDILVTTPNRLVHMLSLQPPTIQLHNVEWLILDEADKLFEDGTLGFRDQVAQIYASCDHPDVRHALFSATLASGVEEFCHTHLDNPVRTIIGLPNSATETVKQELLFVGQESGKMIAIRDIIRKGFTPPVLVFVQSIERAKELFHELIYDGLNVDVIHSERTQAQRDNVVKCFRSGKIWILICTDLMGRGIDFKGVNVVINYDFPPTAVSYIHRIGRTGRAGREGRAITFFTEDDAVNLRSIANVMQNSGCDVPHWMLQLKKPSKNTRKKLSKKPVVRKSIKTASRYDLQRGRKRREMIAASRKRKSTQT